MQTNKGKDPAYIEIIKKLENFFGEDKELVGNTLATSIACAKNLGEFVLENFNARELPSEIRHSLALTWNLYALIFCPEKRIDGIFDMDYQNYFESGDIDERFAMVVKQMYDLCKELKLL